MKNAFTTTALIVAFGLTAGASFAADSSPRARQNNVETSSYFTQSAPSVLARSAVQADLQSLQKTRSGLNNVETSSHFAKTPASVMPRSAVKAEYFQAQKAGTLPAMGDRG